MFDELILHGDTIRARSIVDDRHIIVKIRLPWYRCLPLSVVKRLDFVIDGKEILSENVRILVNGEPMTIREISEKCARTIWCNLDTQDAMLTFDEPLTEGEHEVTIKMVIGLPYRDPSADPPYLPQFVTTTKKMTYEKE